MLGTSVKKRAKLKRVLLNSGDDIKSGDLIEAELGIDKVAGMEAEEFSFATISSASVPTWSCRDEKVSLLVQNLPRGRHNLSYRLRAEIPGKFSVLPTRTDAMYAPEHKANSDEKKINIGE